MNEDTVPEETTTAVPDDFQARAKTAVVNHLNDHELSATMGDVYVVWFVKVLNTWKALISTDIVSGMYWEVTADINSEKIYLDTYVKQSNNALNYHTLENL